MLLKEKFKIALLLATLPLAGLAQRSGNGSRDVASASSASPPGQSSVAEYPLKTPDERAFHIGSGDVLSISVWGEPQLATKAVVRPDGYISMPLVDEVLVKGLTPPQIRQLLTEKLARVLKRPEVYVVVEEIHSRIVYITGEVEHPGAYPLLDDLNVMQLIARSGGLTEYARKHQIYVMRQNTGQKLKVNYDRLIKGEDVAENVVLLPGDMVVIP